MSCAALSPHSEGIADEARHLCSKLAGIAHRNNERPDIIADDQLSVMTASSRPVPRSVKNPTQLLHCSGCRMVSPCAQHTLAGFHQSPYAVLRSSPRTTSRHLSCKCCRCNTAARSINVKTGLHTRKVSLNLLLSKSCSYEGAEQLTANGALGATG